MNESQAESLAQGLHEVDVSAVVAVGTGSGTLVGWLFHPHLSPEEGVAMGPKIRDMVNTDPGLTVNSATQIWSHDDRCVGIFVQFAGEALRVVLWQGHPKHEEVQRVFALIFDAPTSSSDLMVPCRSKSEMN